MLSIAAKAVFALPRLARRTIGIAPVSNVMIPMASEGLRARTTSFAPRFALSRGTPVVDPELSKSRTTAVDRDLCSIGVTSGRSGHA
jgi:hypothetical protein